jgi:hypothetical protein
MAMHTDGDCAAGPGVPDAGGADGQRHISFADVLENCARIGMLTRVARPAESALLVSRLLLEADVLLNKDDINAYMMLVQVAKTMESADRRDAARLIDFEDRRKLT